MSKSVCFCQEIDAEKLDRVMIEAMVKADIDLFYIYAFKKTGLLVIANNWDKLSPDDQEEWNVAFSESEKIGEQ
jgi:hypothetical protein